MKRRRRRRRPDQNHNIPEISNFGDIITSSGAQRLAEREMETQKKIRPPLTVFLIECSVRAWFLTVFDRVQRAGLVLQII